MYYFIYDFILLSLIASCCPILATIHSFIILCSSPFPCFSFFFFCYRLLYNYDMHSILFWMSYNVRSTHSLCESKKTTDKNVFSLLSTFDDETTFSICNYSFSSLSQSFLYDSPSNSLLCIAALFVFHLRSFRAIVLCTMCVFGWVWVCVCVFVGTYTVCILWHLSTTYMYI